jgi:uncharacterized protein
MYKTQEKKALKQLLGCAVNKDEALSLDSLHGYLYGLAIIPEPIHPSEWLPDVFGEEMMEFNNEEEGDRLFGALFGVYNRLLEANENDELAFPFDFDTIKTRDIQRIREWAYGFFMATNLRPQVWGMPGDEDLDDEDEWNKDDVGIDEEVDDAEAEIAACFGVVMGVAFPERIPELFEHDEGKLLPIEQSDPELEAKLFAMLPDAIAGLQVHANAERDDMENVLEEKHQRPPQPIRSEKIGRNDPCHCGSGNKYKKCCGK